MRALAGSHDRISMKTSGIRSGGGSLVGVGVGVGVGVLLFLFLFSPIFFRACACVKVDKTEVRIGGIGL
jgi:hypothetical protein